MNVNCDQVFDILTRGPFPSGEATDEPVERHLLACHECRTLAEALRPAVGLIHEVIDSDEAGLPGYRGQLAEASGQRVSTAVMTAVQATASTVPVAKGNAARDSSHRGATGQTRIWQLAVVALLSSALCFALAAMGIPNNRPAGNGVQQNLVITPAVMRRQPDETAVNFLLSLIQGSECRPTVVASVTASATGGGGREVFHCCTRCHAAQRDRMAGDALARLAESCHACHK